MPEAQTLKWCGLARHPYTVRHQSHKYRNVLRPSRQDNKREKAAPPTSLCEHHPSLRRQPHSTSTVPRFFLRPYSILTWGQQAVKMVCLHSLCARRLMLSPWCLNVSTDFATHSLALKDTDVRNPTNLFEIKPASATCP